MLGDNLRTIREYRGMTQIDLAERIGVTSAAVSSWETGRTEPRIGMIERMAVALNCQKSDIIGYDKPMDLTDHERNIIIAYRQNKEMQLAVDRLLGIERIKLYNKKTGELRKEENNVGD